MRNNTWLRRLAYGIGMLAISAAAFVFWIVVYVQLHQICLIACDKIPFQREPYAIVLGASVKLDGTPSDALYDRIETAVRLYGEGKVTKLLVTGDDGKFHVNEVATMKNVAMELGVPESDIVVDGQGYRTYESCKRAKQIYNIEEAYIVTQRFHLGRALYLCDSFGIWVKGEPADMQTYQRITFFWARDLLSSFKAWWDVNVIEPKPPVDESERD